MITFFDLINKDDFRSFVSKRIAANSQEPYSFPSELPPLYKYRSLSAHAIDDIVNNKITLTSIGEFNDVFDGAIHQYGTMEEIERTAEAKWTEMETLRIAARLPEGILRREAIVKPYIEHLKTESRLKFRELDYLGTFVGCFSHDNNSTLMWAHYADSNKGICIEYDFNKLPTQSQNLLRNTIFPVAYTTEPIDVNDLLTENGSQVYRYPIDAAVLCTALNKSVIWHYEQEWRIVWVLASSIIRERKLTINSIVSPSKIYLGYHFLRSFFYYNNRDTDEINKCKTRINKFYELIAFLQKNEIPVAIMMPSIGSYHFIHRYIPIDKLFGYMRQHFHDKKPQNIRYYYVLHDYLIDLFDKTQESTHD